jgi:cell division protein FtsQ
VSGRGPALGDAVHALANRIIALNLPRGFGYFATAVLFSATATYGVIVGGHLPTVTAAIHDGADSAARAAGFGLSTIAISGRKYLTEADIRRAAGIGPGTSVLFFDAATAREGLLSIPWIADAQVRKLYPDRIDIDIVEREAFALWQLKGKIQVIAQDGTVIAPGEAAPRPNLPLVVGIGADKRAKDIVALFDKFPDIAAKTYAAVLVAERRWNLRLKNGMDIRLPESDPAAALNELVALDRDRKLLSRDIVAVDLRLRDRVTVRMSDALAKAREDAAKAKSAKRKGSET